MTRPNYLRALEAAWDEMKVWVENGLFVPENEESIQCFLYRGIVKQLGTAIGVRSKPTTTHTKSRSDRKKQSDTNGTHFPDFILGDPKEVAIEIKFARANASILGSCKQDVAKLKNYHSAPGVSKVFILFDVNPDFAFLNEPQRAALQAVDPDCRLMHYPDTLSHNPQKLIAQDAANKAKANIEIKRLQLTKKRSDAAKKAHETIRMKKAAVVAAAK
jgi:hypothetical protein